MRFSEIAGEKGLFIDGDWIETKDQDPNGKVRLIQLADVGAGEFNNKSNKYITETKAAELLCTYLKKGDILIARLGEPLCKACIFPYDGLYITAVDVTILRVGNKAIEPKYLVYLLNSPWFKVQVKRYESGTTRKRISRKNLDRICMKFPSLPEQKRIVARIEELFSELDSGVETLKKTKQLLSVYRQSVLKSAFEGKYTELWRKSQHCAIAERDFDGIKIHEAVYKDISGDENEIKLSLPAGWIKIRIGDVFAVEVGSTPSRRVPEYWNGDVAWVSSGEVHFNVISETEERITKSGLEHASTKVHPIGTIMLAMIGEGKTRGQAAILNIPAAHNQNTAAILVSKTPCQPRYIYYFLQLNYENTRRVGSGNNQKALNKERVRALRFPFASFEEQKIIVSEIEARFSACDSIEKTVDAALQQAESMRQSILKKAFEGKL